MNKSIKMAIHEVNTKVIPKIPIKKYKVIPIYRKTDYLGYYVNESVFDIMPIIKLNITQIKISDFEYVRYKYGPFDQNIYNHINDLRWAGVITEEPAYTPMGDEYITYKINDETCVCVDELGINDTQVADEVLESLKGYGAKALVDLAYKTKPMAKIGAMQDNDAGLNEKLDLSAS